MACESSITTIYSPGSPDVKAFTVVDKAVRVTVFGLNVEDTVTFQRVKFCAERATASREGCCIYKPSTTELSSAIEYRIGTCPPMLSPERNMIIIPFRGTYIPVINAVSSPDLTIEIDEVEGDEFTDIEKGIVPCGFCLDKEWKTTGAERCNEHFIEQEEISNCGHIRWTRTTVRCGYFATVPVVIDRDEGCCGDFQIGYMFHPDETRDPDATTAVEDCNANVVGYIYPTAGNGHTVPIEECGGNVLGWAVNASPFAPALWDCGTGCNSCGVTTAQNIEVPDEAKDVKNLRLACNTLFVKGSEVNNGVKSFGLDESGQVVLELDSGVKYTLGTELLTALGGSNIGYVIKTEEA